MNITRVAQDDVDWECFSVLQNSVTKAGLPGGFSPDLESPILVFMNHLVYPFWSKGENVRSDNLFKLLFRLCAVPLNLVFNLVRPLTAHPTDECGLGQLHLVHQTDRELILLRRKWEKISLPFLLNNPFVNQKNADWLGGDDLGTATLVA